MTFKKAAACLLFVVLLAGTVETHASAKSDSVDLPSMLIVYEENISKEAQADLQTLVKILTYMQQRVTYLTEDESLNVLGDYDRIICFKLDCRSESFLRALSAPLRKVLFIGGTTIAGYIQTKRYPIAAEDNEDKFVTAEYVFSDDEPISSLLEMDGSYILSGKFDYEQGKMHSNSVDAPMYCGYGDFRFTPFSDLSAPVIEASLTNEIAFWLWPYNGTPYTYAQYIVLDEVYPFTPPDLLMDTVEYLVDKDKPFVISVMPIYANGDYPAMKRFCEVLRYAQANGGTIILHAPITVREGENKDQVWDYLTIAMQAYINYGIYPVAVQLPESYMFEESGIDIYKRYSTIFWYGKDDAASDLSLDLKERTNLIYFDGHKMIGNAIYLTGAKKNVLWVHSTAVYINLYDDPQSIRTKIDNCIASDIPLKNLLETDNTVYANSLVIRSKEGQIYYNDKKVSLAYKPFTYDKNFDYGKGLLHTISLDLKGVSRSLLFLVIGASAVFIVFVIIGRIMLRKRFIKPKLR